MHHTWPVTIIACRYGGAYEGAPFAAFNEYPEMIQKTMGDDTTCATFFDLYEQLRERPIGRGGSPQEAYDDLVRKLKPGS